MPVRIELAYFSEARIPAITALRASATRLQEAPRATNSQDFAMVEYRAALAGMDWQFEFCDEHAKWAAGTNALARLHRMQRELDPSGDIWLSFPGALSHGAPRPHITQVAQ
jgi:hypothetical protein